MALYDRDKAGDYAEPAFSLAVEAARANPQPVRPMTFAPRTKEPLAVIDRHVRKLARARSNAARLGFKDMADLRRFQIIALNELRRDLLGRTPKEAA